MLVEFECPACKGHICEKWSLDGSSHNIRLMYWHMILNPGLAFNELVLGQRTPAEMYLCKSCTSPMVDRSYVHCNACGEFHPGRIWSYGNAFRNWIGVVCPTCAAPIPCLWNVWSRVVLVLTAPIWWFPIKANRANLLRQQFRRISDTKNVYLDKASKQPKPINYWRMGLTWGLLMNFIFAIMGSIAAAKVFELDPTFVAGVFSLAAIAGLLLWVPAGLLFAFTMKLILDKKGDQNLHLSFNSDGAVICSSTPQSVAEQIDDSAQQSISCKSDARNH